MHLATIGEAADQWEVLLRRCLLKSLYVVFHPLKVYFIMIYIGMIWWRIIQVMVADRNLQHWSKHPIPFNSLWIDEIHTDHNSRKKKNLSQWICRTAEQDKNLRDRLKARGRPESDRESVEGEKDAAVWECGVETVVKLSGEQVETCAWQNQ